MAGATVSFAPTPRGALRQEAEPVPREAFAFRNPHKFTGGEGALAGLVPRADAKKCPPLVPADTEDGLCHPTADGTKKRKKVISQSFTLRRSSTNGNSPGQLDSGAKIALFGQPLAIICGEDDTLPQLVQDLLAILYMKGPSTEGIFRKAANEKARKELKEDLNKGGNVDLKSKSVHLLAVVLKVTVLVEFLINNCSEIFGEDIALPACALAEESPEHTDSSTEHLCAAHQNDSAYDSPDPEAEGSPCASQMEQPKGRSSSVSRRYPTCISAPSLTNFRNDISTMDRRYSEPDLSFQNHLEGRIRKEKLNKSEDNFPVQQKQLGLEALERRLAILPSQLSTDSLPKTSSSCSLESSDGSVFTSSPVVSPSSPKKTFLNRPQSFSTKATEDCSMPIREIKKHSMSFSFANRRKTLIKTQSWGPGKNIFFQRDSFTKKEDHFSCRVVQENSPDDDKPLPVAHQQRSRFRSADEVFREVDQRNPGRPPSYEEATKNCLATEVLSHNLTVQTMRLKVSNQDALPPHPRSSFAQDAAHTALRDLPRGRVSAAKDSDLETETLSVTVGINSSVSLPVTPGVYRLRAMSESCQKNKLEYVARRCSQPVFEVDQIQYAKESYV
ncbi:t-cell activation rho gtpase-activating hypothetical protein [Limosa lapponica baueri]|uniref:Rho-GAP domain-containing protein n=1 Tax=Limosa lapponica baueri TaxID=1758121 RepID=A0A2I0TWM2_LIMLA|nr:t-cell activation rho gtpase-activating hypothetical protein [Limosa lapponica baueri]